MESARGQARRAQSVSHEADGTRNQVNNVFECSGGGKLDIKRQFSKAWQAEVISFPEKTFLPSVPYEQRPAGHVQPHSSRPLREWHQP